MAILKSGETVHCPQCGAPQTDGPVDVYVPSGVTGEDSREVEECEKCHAPIHVMRKEDGLYSVQ